MSVKMTDEALAAWRDQTPEDMWREVQRARRSEAEKDGTITTIAEALASSANRDDGGPCWCPTKDGPVPHEDYCERHRAALRLAGMFPVGTACEPCGSDSQAAPDQSIQETLR